MSEFEVEVFFDGDCPLCTKEINMLRKLDRKGRIRFTDIAAPTFRAADYDSTMDSFMEKIRGRLPDGSWIEGVEVFRKLYGAVGFAPVVAVTRVPGISHLLDFGYEMFAKNRLKWTGRCDANGCAIPAKRA